jgi:GTP-binding protein
MRAGEQVILLEGGQGGRGNASFKSSRNRAPVIAENGEPGSEKWLELELKVVADAAFVGAPNAGKSSLLAALSNARPKVADYPFTTLVPNLGVCERGARQVVFADVPGLLEGASEGLGLGLEFLRHCERCRALVHVVDGSAPDPVADFWTIRRELESYGRGLPEKRAVVAYTKTDLPDSSDYWGDIREVFEAEGLAAVAVSSATGEGLDELVKEVVGCLGEGARGGSADAESSASEPQFASGEGESRGASPRVEADWDEPPPASPGTPPAQGEWGLDPGSEVRTAGSAREERRAALRERARRRAPLSSFIIERDGFHQEYTVRGEGLERLAAMTNFAYYESLQRFQRSLKESGAEKALVRSGVQEGDTVFVGDVEFQWSADRGEAALYGAWLEQARAEGTGRQGAARWPKKGTSA